MDLISLGINEYEWLLAGPISAENSSMVHLNYISYTLFQQIRVLEVPEVPWVPLVSKRRH